MFDTILAEKRIERCDSSNNLPFSYKNRALIIWEEHCVECSPPSCYNLCKNYQPRIDHKCVRFVGGLQPTNELCGVLRYGISCEFRKWAKLEGHFYGRVVSDEQENRYDRISNFVGKCAFCIAKIIKRLSPSLKIYGAYVAFRDALLSKIGRGVLKGPDVLYINCILKEKEEVQLLVQIDSEKILYSKVHLLKRGNNEIRIPLNGVLDNILSARVFITPLEETNTKIVFGWIDLFYDVADKSSYPVEGPAEKVKVVAWDLDNTLWNGILVEDEKVCLRDEAVRVIKELDSRGILNTIVSKNNHDDAMQKLKEFGIDDYFLSPAINWSQKSQNLKAIAENLNLGINSFAFIDDNIRERSEMESALPMVRVYSETDIEGILGKPEFDVPITEASKSRRLSYMQEVSRKELLTSYKDDYDSFLKGLEMTLTVEKVCDSNYDRCFELLQRSNQLNLSTHRYSKEEFDILIQKEDIICKAFRVKDKFGDYGIVSFLSTQISGSQASIIDFVISCRVAKKKVEQAIVISLKDELINLGVKQIRAVLIKTKKNGPLASVFDDLPFEKISEDGEKIHFILNDISSISDPGIISTEIINN